MGGGDTVVSIAREGARLPGASAGPIQRHDGVQAQTRCRRWHASTMLRLRPPPLRLLLLLLLQAELCASVSTTLCRLRWTAACVGEELTLSSANATDTTAALVQEAVETDADLYSKIALLEKEEGVVVMAVGNRLSLRLLEINSTAGTWRVLFNGTSASMKLNCLFDACSFAPLFADFDANGVADLLIGVWNGLLYFPDQATAPWNLTAAASSTPSLSETLVARDYGDYVTVTAGDVDGDGDLDLVSGDALGIFHYWRNDGNVTSPNLTTVADSDVNTNPFAELATSESSVPFLVDVDKDGDLDMLAGDDDGLVSLFLNHGATIAPSFAEVQASDSFVSGIDVGQYAAPFMTSVFNGDGLPDLLLGAFDGSLTYLVGSDSRTNPSFTKITDDSANPFESVLVDGFGGSNVAAALADFDSDGDLDVVSGQTLALFYHENNATSGSGASEPQYVRDESVFVNVDGLPRPAALDIDWDGDLDIVFGNNPGVMGVVENLGNSTFPSFATAPSASSVFDSVDVGSASAPAFFDLDGDSDDDLIVGSELQGLQYWENMATGPGNNGSAFVMRNSSEESSGSPLFGMTQVDGDRLVPALADLDGDGLVDLVVGNENGLVAAVRLNQGNTSHPSFAGDAAVVDSNTLSLVGQDVGFWATPTFGDVDLDGDLDAVVGSLDDGFALFMNGRCLQSAPCSKHGLCDGDTNFYPTCECLLGFTDAQCNDCLDGFYGTSCNLCPGAGTVTEPTLADVCSQQGECDDGIGGSGVCTCSDASFSGDACQKGACPGGYFRQLNATVFVCQPCPVGFAREENATSSDSCTACLVDLGQTTRKAGASSCDGCLNGYFYHDHREECVSCDDGMDCSAGLSSLAKLPVKKDWWRVHPSVSAVDECPWDDACVGGNGTGDSLCANGYHGAACAVCDADWWFDTATQSCRRCAGAAYTPSTIVSMLAIFVVLALIVRHLFLGGRQDDAHHHHRQQPEVSIPAPDGEESASEVSDGDIELPSARVPTAVVEEDAGCGVEAEADAAVVADMNAEAIANDDAASSVVSASDISDTPDSGVDAGGAHRDDGEEQDVSVEDREQDQAATERVDRRQSARAKAKVIWSFLQIVHGFPSILVVDLPRSYRRVLSVLSITNLDFVDTVPTDCVARTDFVDELLVLTLTPIVLAVCICAVWRLHFCFTTNRERTRRLYTELLLLLSYLVFPSVSSKIFQSFSCTQLSHGNSYLRADYSIECGSSRHELAKAWAGAFIFVYPVAIPCLYLWLLWHRRDKIDPDPDEHEEITLRAKHLDRSAQMDWSRAMQLSKTEFRRRDESLHDVAFLFDAYLPRVAWYYEAVECARRLALSGILVLFDGASQLVFGMAVALVGAQLFSKVRPFVDPADDSLAELTQWNLFIILFTGLLIRVDVAGEDGQSQALYSALLIVVTLVAVLLAVVLFVRESVRSLAEFLALVRHGCRWCSVYVSGACRGPHTGSPESGMEAFGNTEENEIEEENEREEKEIEEEREAPDDTTPTPHHMAVTGSSARLATL